MGTGHFGGLGDADLPSGLEEYRRRGCDQFSRLIGFPLLGLAIGVVLVLVAAFCSAVFNRIAGGIIFALLATAFLDLKDSGRGGGLRRVRAVPRRIMPSASEPDGAFLLPEIGIMAPCICIY